VNGTIIQTAVTNPRLRLELEYRVLSMLREGDNNTAEPSTHVRLDFQVPDPRISDELACLLSVI